MVKCLLWGALMVLLVAGLLAGATAAIAHGRSVKASRRVIEGGPDRLADTRSLMQAINAAHRDGRNLHIMFVHGIRAEGPGESSQFTARLATAFGVKASKPRRIMLPLSPWPKDATMAGKPSPGSPLARTPIWPTQAAWTRSLPFLDRAEIVTAHGKVFVDEVNYWPLLFPLKCRFLLVPEHDLAGNDAAHLKLCAAHGWISKSQLQQLLSTKPASGGGARVNRVLKQQILDWGLSDAVIALGPMKRYLNDMIDQACAQALETGPGDRYVVVSESLGSFVVLDAFAERRANVAEVMKRTADLYFFANQFALLELARVDGVPPRTGPTPANMVPPSTPSSPLGALAMWARTEPGEDHDFTAAGPPVAGLEKQIVAFSDPSDLLTFDVPPLDGVKVVNLYDRQGFDLFGLLANPIAAHTGHVRNKAVWKVLLRQ